MKEKFWNFIMEKGIADSNFSYPLFFFKRTVLILLLCVLMAISCKCPYGFTVNALPAHLKTVAIPTFSNDTFEYGIDEEFTQILIDEVEKDNSLNVTNNMEDADSVLEGKILNYSKVKSSYDESGVVTEYKVSVTVSWKFTDTIKERVYAQDNRMVGWETYLIPDGDSEELEDEAKQEAMNMLAEEMITKIVSNW
jgi:outer membrane lipopolysaccharide assembly protein LptE/RlpB